MLHVYVITGITKSGREDTVYRDAPNMEKAMMIGARRFVKIISCKRLVPEDDDSNKEIN